MRVGRLPAALLVGIGATALLGIAHADEIRGRAEEGLGHGMPAREAELARGFVLGEDGGIDPTTVEDFRRSGLSHLLAVSGQNVALLALLATPLLAALGIPLRVRLVWILALIAVYVPLAGAGPSIQRAAVMGALGLLATLDGRRAPRLYALLAAAIVTLAVDPGIGGDVGWQLSFAAVLGILALATPLRRAIGVGIGSSGWRRALADGAAMTIAATVATTPLVALHFGEVSTVALPANLLALPAVAPAMWLGMLAAAGAQAPGFPVEALNAVNAPLLAYIAQLAAWWGRPGWASLEVRIGPAGVVLSYGATCAAALLIARWRRRLRLARSRRARIQRRSSLGRGAPAVTARAAKLAPIAALAVALAAFVASPGAGSDRVEPPTRGLRVSVLDVGQGDAILIQPARAPAILVDGGPPGEGLAGMLRLAGVERLGAAVVTHDQSDHSGGIDELLGAMPVGSLVYAALDRRTLAAARAAGAVPRRIAAGATLRSAGLRLEALWPPVELLSAANVGEDANRLSLVLRLRWRDFSMLLTGDAESEAAPLDPGALDVLKVAHHGSEDGGLDDLLDRARPSVAIISVGEGNPFGHPTAATLDALAARGVPILRTDRHGAVVLDVRRGSFHVSTED